MANKKNIKVVPVKKSQDDDYGVFVSRVQETRFVIINEETGEILDDAQGYGYKSPQAAYRCWSYKTKPKKARKHIQDIRKKNRSWVESNSDFFDSLEDDVFHAEKAGYTLTKEDFFSLLDSAPGNALKSMPCTKAELWQYWRR